MIRFIFLLLWLVGSLIVFPISLIVGLVGSIIAAFLILIYGIFEAIFIPHKYENIDA